MLADYAHCVPIQTRWMDNDAFGHINNAHYYSYFDTAILALGINVIPTPP